MSEPSSNNAPHTSDINASSRANAIQKHSASVGSAIRRPFSQAARAVADAIIDGILERRERRQKWRNGHFLFPHPPPPEPPDPRLRRRITFDASSSVETRPLKYLQDRSPLFGKLPPEIRAQIFALVVGTHQVLLDLRHRPVGNPSDPIDRKRISAFEELSLPFRDCHMRISPTWTNREELLNARLLALPLSCRRAYTEALPLLYRNNLFLTYDDDLVTHLPALLNPTTQLSNLAHLSFSWYLLYCPYFSAPSAEERQRYRHLNRFWLDLWQTLARLSQTLKVLLVRLSVPQAGGCGWDRAWMEREEEVLGAARRMGDGREGRWRWRKVGREGMERFEVELAWALKRGGREVEGPWRVVRRLDSWYPDHILE